MKFKNIALILSILGMQKLNSQKLVGKIENGFSYIEHKVEDNQDLASIALQYGVSEDEIKALNGASALSSNSIVRIPLNSIIKQECVSKNCIPVYHIVGKSEGLYRIGVAYNNIKMPQLRKLNNLANDNLSLGKEIIVGYVPESVTTAKFERRKEVPAEEKLSTNNAPKYSIDNNKKAEMPKAEAQKKDSTLNVISQIKDLKTEVKPKVVNEVKENNVITGKVIEIKDTVKVDNTEYVAKKLEYSNKEGAFKSEFKNAGFSMELSAASFKSESGWKDGMYFVLVNEIEVGITVKLSVGDKVIYAKVTGPLPEVKKANDVSIRLNDAASFALGYSENEKFKVKLSL
ncbi:LysM domain-containing protein [Chitinophagaceae bacterium LY-5]|uniref:LysM domain-containing protein n=2 Tax=Polluticaenibacter yanchengensis TaxID=3014562 RepID=A0ABT4UQC6_9BACT|nr:LysM domain-containing protein [Chitinophagaceae bacterium LY-5]